MSHTVVPRKVWLAQREELLLLEKAHTHERERIAKLRQALPWVKVEKDYRFRNVDGELSLLDLFGDRNQLIIYHLMFGTGWDAPCIGCSQWADALSGTTHQFKHADARVIAVSRAPVEQLLPVQEARSWRFTWVSSLGSDFNLDYYASSEDLSEGCKTETGSQTVAFDRGENHGVSVFTRNEANDVFHTYSSYNRGIEALNGSMGYLDLLPQGRTW
jgi:predicted dithiol-disulfide oxidoreductase (DUF899 family)